MTNTVLTLLLCRGGDARPKDHHETIDEAPADAIFWRRALVVSSDSYGFRSIESLTWHQSVDIISRARFPASECTATRLSSISANHTTRSAPRICSSDDVVMVFHLRSTTHPLPHALAQARVDAGVVPDKPVPAYLPAERPRVGSALRHRSRRLPQSSEPRSLCFFRLGSLSR